MGRVRVRRAVIALCAALLTSCAGQGPGGGVLVISAAGDADTFFPPIARQQQSREITDQLFDKLADIGPGLVTIGDIGWTPRLAKSWAWSRDSSSVTFHLDPRATWHDGVPVRAADVRFAYQVYTAPAVGAATGSDIHENVDSITVGDSLTCTAWFRGRSPERFFQLVYAMAPLPAHLLSKIPLDSLRTSAFARAPVGSGPYRFVRWEQKQRIEVEAFGGYYGTRPSLQRIIWSIVPEGRTASERVIAGEADFIESITLAEMDALKKNPSVRAIPLPSINYTFVIFNTRDGASDRPHPILGDRSVRRALTMALDRPAMVRNIFDSLAVVARGPFAREQWAADTTLRQIATDPSAAARLLDSLGWKPGPDGIRARGGRKLALTFVVSTSSQPRQRLATLLQEAWKQVGVQLNIEKVDNATMGARANGHLFDLVALSLFSSSSPTGIRQVWSTAAIAMANGFNVGRFSNSAVDAQIDSALAANSVQAARAHFRAAYQQLTDDAAGVWMWEQLFVGALNRRATPAPFRADAFWMSFPSWRVSGGGQVPPDAAPAAR